MGQDKLGLMFYYGLGVREDRREAARWFRAAAEQGDAGAQAILGSLYAAGDGVDKDKIQAFFWYSLAADQGHRGALDSKTALIETMSPGEVGEALDRLAAWAKRHPRAVPPPDSSESRRRARDRDRSPGRTP